MVCVGMCVHACVRACVACCVPGHGSSPEYVHVWVCVGGRVLGTVSLHGLTSAGIAVWVP